MRPYKKLPPNERMKPHMNNPKAISNTNRQFVLPESHFYDFDPREGYPVDVFTAELPIVLSHTSGAHVIADADGVLLLIACEGWSESVCYPDREFRQASVSEVCGHFRIRPNGRLGYDSHFTWNSPPLPPNFRDWVRGWWYGLAPEVQSHFAMRMRHPGFPTEALIKSVGGLDTVVAALGRESA